MSASKLGEPEIIVVPDHVYLRYSKPRQWSIGVPYAKRDRHLIKGGVVGIGGAEVDLESVYGDPSRIEPGRVVYLSLVVPTAAKTFIEEARSPMWVLSIAPDGDSFTALIEDEKEAVEATFQMSDVESAYHECVLEGEPLTILYGSSISSSPYKIVGPDERAEDSELVKPEVVAELFDEARWDNVFSDWSSWNENPASP